MRQIRGIRFGTPCCGFDLAAHSVQGRDFDMVRGTGKATPTARLPIDLTGRYQANTRREGVEAEISGMHLCHRTRSSVYLLIR
jgi:hypothetical protein